MNRVISIRKMGTRRGEPHYGVECRACRGNYGKSTVVAVAHLDKPSAVALAEHHLAKHGCAW